MSIGRFSIIALMASLLLIPAAEVYQHHLGKVLFTNSTMEKKALLTFPQNMSYILMNLDALYHALVSERLSIYLLLQV